jgi:hypothetical protein
MIALIKKCGYREGKVNKTYVKWNRRSLKRAKPNTGDFYPNCIWGPFKGGGPCEMDLSFPNQEGSKGFLPGGVDFEVDGINYHRDKEKDAKRDMVLKANGWTVVRIPDALIYRVFVPLLNKDLNGVLP